MNDYGHIDAETPSFAISLYEEYHMTIDEPYTVEMKEVNRVVSSGIDLI